MSTFDGIVNEFPTIRIDYFRHHASRPPPAACFLSHVHSDHLQGLETLKMPFVYCSVTTKKILLRLERYPHRMNFARGILEARKQTYKSLRMILRGLPLETPVELELGPKAKLRVTLFDANHCPGAVMFLIEDTTRAILYTGDMRAEAWWVNTLTRNPILLPYSCGAKVLNCIYLDTTFASRDDLYEHFPTKEEGLKELISKVSKCSEASTFYFRSWTFGYEDVWLTLSNYLQSPVHVDTYQLNIFKSLAEGANYVDRGTALSGFSFGNQQQLGCLTDDRKVSIHSCEPGTSCYEVLRQQKNVVWITPIVSRLKNGEELPEIGAGGGGGDLNQISEIEFVNETDLEALRSLCSTDPKYEVAIDKLDEVLSSTRRNGVSSISLDGLSLGDDETVSLTRFLGLLSRKEVNNENKNGPFQDRVIHFPYSRHSSLSELRHFISSFHPKDICPCTVDPRTWSEEVSVRSLFGDLCSGQTYEYDRINRLLATEVQGKQSKKRKRDNTDSSQLTNNCMSEASDEIYKSAKTSLDGQSPDLAKRSISQQHSPHSDALIVPVSIRILHEAIDNDHKSTNLQNFDGHEAKGLVDECDSDTSSSISLSDAEWIVRVKTRGERSQFEESPQDDRASRAIDNGQRDIDARTARRKQAYKAARLALSGSNHDAWVDLRLRSVGWKGHNEAEVEL